MKNFAHLAPIWALTTLITAAPAMAANPPADRPIIDMPDEVNAIPALPHTPAPVANLIYARQFRLEQGYEFEWRAEHPTVTAGWLLVLEINPDLVFPRQVAEPVLYVGSTTAERVNVGKDSGRIIVIVPSTLTEKGEIALNLSEAPMWFGTPGLPEQVDAAKVDAERALANAAAISPFSAEVIAAARSNAGETLVAANREGLRHAAAELIKTHSRVETELADIILSESDAVVQQPAGVK